MFLQSLWGCLTCLHGWMKQRRRLPNPGTWSCLLYKCWQASVNCFLVKKVRCIRCFSPFSYELWSKYSTGTWFALKVCARLPHLYHSTKASPLEPGTTLAHQSHKIRIQTLHHSKHHLGVPVLQGAGVQKHEDIFGPQSSCWVSTLSPAQHLPWTLRVSLHNKEDAENLSLG